MNVEKTFSSITICRCAQRACSCVYFIPRDMTDVFSKAMGYRDCDKMMDMAVYGHVATGIFTLAWVLCLAGAMLSCFTCCYIEVSCFDLYNYNNFNYTFIEEFSTIAHGNIFFLIWFVCTESRNFPLALFKDILCLSRELLNSSSCKDLNIC